MQSLKIIKRKSISLEEKLKILQDVDAGILTKKAVSKKYGISFSTLSTIIKNKNKIDSSLALGCSSSIKRLRFTSHKHLEQMLADWFKMTSSHFPVSGSLLRAKAKQISMELNLNNFVCSDGWLWRFKKRHNISSLVSEESNCDEGNDEEISINDWSKLLNMKKSMFAEKDIFNLDATGVFYNLLPEKSIDFKGIMCEDGSKSEERLTVLLCSNSDGSEKLELWVVGNSQNRRCFKHYNRSHLPWVYSYQKNSWIDKAIFQDWIIKFQTKMSSENRKILLTLEYDFVHKCKDLHLPNIEVVFFPPTASSWIRTKTGGIIYCFKRDYRKRLITANVINYESDQPPVNWNVLQAMRALSAAWESVTPLTIKNCFHKLWKVEDTQGPEPEDRLDQEPEEWTLSRSILKTSKKLTFTDFVNVDIDVCTVEPFELDVLTVSKEKEDDLTMSEDEEDVLTVSEDQKDILTVSEDKEDDLTVFEDKENVLTVSDEKEEEEFTKPSRKEVMQALSVIQRFADTMDVDPDFTSALYKLSCVCNQLTRPLIVVEKKD